MSVPSFTLSAFGDEIADDLHVQLEVLNSLDIGYLELRGAWNINVLDFGNDQAARVRRVCNEHNVSVSCIGSPIGKSPIEKPIEQEVSNLERIFRVAEIVGARLVRVFSFYPPDTSSNVHYDAYVEEATVRLARLTELADRQGFQLVLENERGIVGDTIARCRAILSAIDSPHLRFAWDPANFVSVDETRVTERGWPLLGPFTTHVHIKDSRLADGSICVAGAGDGQVRELLVNLRDSGYRGFLALEPHLAVAGHSGGFSGVSGMTEAVKALRQVMVAVGCEERR